MVLFKQGFLSADVVMKIARISTKNSSTYGIVVDGRFASRETLQKNLGRALPSSVCDFFELLALNAKLKAKLVSAAEKADKAIDSVKLLAPVDGRPKVICIGLNYIDHVRELGVKPPDEPIMFMKPYTAITGPADPIEYPSHITKLDYEAELGIVIGRRCKDVKMRVNDNITGYVVFNDVTARDLQFKDGQWTRGKSFDTFAPIGPWVVTADEIDNPQNLKVVSRVNGEIRQNSNTRNMIFDVEAIVSFVSRVMTLDAGDIIATGTPPGVGVFWKPQPRLLKVGDMVEIEIEDIGTIKNKVIAKV
ncbi:MAG: fumarylacetoacetate hydrolase family protein [Thaumarchaeota archaeon]|nr:fumarylacetoacetate hydrolase family protein [Nitrososphaerota archaeon]